MGESHNYDGGFSTKVNKKMKLVPEHVVAARGMLRMSQADLAKVSGVSENTINNFEGGRTSSLREETLWRIQTALEERGIIFHNGGRPTVTLDRSIAKVSDPSK